MNGESMEVRIARLEEAMKSVKEDTSYLRQGLDDFKHAYWRELAKAAAKVGSMSAIISIVVAAMATAIAHAFWR